MLLYLLESLSVVCQHSLVGGCEWDMTAGSVVEKQEHRLSSGMSPLVIASSNDPYLRSGVANSGDFLHFCGNYGIRDIYQEIDQQKN